MGTPEFAVPSLKKIVESNHEVVGVVTSQDNAKVRGKNIESPVKKFAKEKGLKTFQPENLMEKSFCESMKFLKPDLIVVVAFKLLPKEIFQIPPKGTINLHASLLPNYRGAAPINWAIINGEKETGVTTFFIDEKVDTGNIILQKSEKIFLEDNFSSLYDRLKIIGSDLLLETINLISSNNFSEKIQKKISAKKLAPKISKNFCKINWNQESEKIINFIRGLANTPAAFSILNGKKIKIFSLSIEQSASIKLSPGEIFCSKNEIYVGTLSSSLKINELQMEGKSKMIASEFLKGNKLEGNFNL